MKKLFQSLIVFLGCCTLVACGEDFLNLAPVSEANVEEFYRNAEDIEVAVNGVFATLQSSGLYGSAYWAMSEMRSHNTESGRPFQQLVDIDIFSVPPTNPVVLSYWNTAYQGIARANVVLDRLDDAEIESEQLRNRYEGDLKFFRALIYFNLVRAFGDVPLILNEVTDIQEGYGYLREDQAIVYEQIIRDLSEAAELLPEKNELGSSQIGRATKGAANALLGKVYLTVHDYDNASNRLQDVINSGQYELWEDYSDNFAIERANGIESIFEVQFKKGGTGTGSNFMHQFAPYQSTEITNGVGIGTGVNRPTENMASAYEEGDLRRDISMADGYETADGEWINDRWVRKYIDEAPYASGDNDNNWIVLRYADVLLMSAEVLNELGQTNEALVYLNQIRERAGLGPLNGLSQEDFRLAVEHERRIELAFEGHIWWDMLRTNRALEIMSGLGYNIQEFMLVYPIPLSEIETNPNITQNPGY